MLKWAIEVLIIIIFIIIIISIKKRFFRPL